MGPLKGKKAWQFIGIVMLLFIIQQLQSNFGGFVANAFSYDLIDPDHVFAWITVHHIGQMVLSMMVVMAVYLIYKVDFGFKIGDYKTGLQYVKIFSFAFIIYAIGGYVIGYFTHSLVAYTFPLNFRNVAGTLGFQLFFSGTSEEILFRALPVSLMVFVSGKSIQVKVGKWNLSLETIIAALLFAIAHVQWTLFPLAINYFSSFQLVYAFVLGVIYGKTYQKSGSVLYPMAMHGISNTVMVGTGYLFTLMS